MSALGVDLSKWLIEQRPKLLVCDAETAAEVCTTLAHVLGCNLATVYVKAGPAAYEKTIKSLFAQAHDNAMGTAKRAGEMAQSPEVRSSQ